MRKSWIAFASVLIISFAALLLVGRGVYQQAPPIPDKVVSRSGTLVLSGDDIRTGQNVWQAMGGMELGSVWGHGSYVAPDWTADWLHREAQSVLDGWSKQEFGTPYDAAGAERQGMLVARLKTTMRTNTLDPATGTVVVDNLRARAFEENFAHYRDVFTNGRNAYAIPADTLRDET